MAAKLTATDKLARTRTFLDQMVEAAPASHRDSLRAAVDAIPDEEAGDLAETVANAMLRQEDYSRAMDEGRASLTEQQQALDALTTSLQAERTRLDDWWKVNEPVLTQAKRLMDAGRWPGDEPAADPQPTRSDGSRTGQTHTNGNSTSTTSTKAAMSTSLTADDLDRRFAEFGQQALPVMTAIPRLIAEHAARFKGEILDVDALIAHPKLQELGGLRGVYQEVYKDQLAELETKTKTEREDALRKEGYEKAKAELLKQSGPPYAFAGQVPSTPLDILEQPEDALKKAQDELDPAALAQEYLSKVAEIDPDASGWVGG